MKKVLMDSQQVIQDTARQPIGQEQEVLGISRIIHIFIMAAIGLALLAATLLEMRGMSAISVILTTTTMSTAWTTVFVQPLQSRLRSLTKQ